MKSLFRVIKQTEPIQVPSQKAEGGMIHFVLPAAVGDVRIVDLSVEEVMALMA